MKENKQNEISEKEANSGKLEVEATKENFVEQQVSQVEGLNQTINVNNEISIGDASMIYKGPSKPTRDVPAKTALVTILNAVNPVVQAYDKLHSSTAATNPAVTSNKLDVVQHVAGASGIQIGNDRVKFNDQPVAEITGSKSSIVADKGLWSSAVARGTQAVVSTLHATNIMDATGVNNSVQQEVGTAGNKHALLRDAC